jgi:hypothetical protein
MNIYNIKCQVSNITTPAIEGVKFIQSIKACHLDIHDIPCDVAEVFNFPNLNALSLYSPEMHGEINAHGDGGGQGCFHGIAEDLYIRHSYRYLNLFGDSWGNGYGTASSIHFKKTEGVGAVLFPMYERS